MTRPEEPRENASDIRRQLEELLTKGRSEVDRNRIAQKAIELLLERGVFIRDKSGDCFYFSYKAHRSFAVGSQEYIDHISVETGINPASQDFKYVIEAGGVYARQNSVETNIHRFAVFDESTLTVCINHRSDAYLKITQLSVITVVNGSEGIYFIYDKNVQSFELSEGDPQEAINTAYKFLVAQCNFDNGNDSTLSGAEQKYLWWHVILLFFFLSNRRTKPPMVFLGEPGSGKTTILRKLGVALFGEKFEVLSLSEEEKDVVAAISRRSLVVLDNVDRPSKFLDDMIARVSTGTSFARRKLYTDNDEVVILPRAHLAITSMHPYFNRVDVADRILIFRLVRNEDTNFKDENTIISEILENRNLILSGLVYSMQWALQNIERNARTVTSTDFRMADAALLLMRMADDPENMRRIISMMKKEQTSFVSEGNPLMELIYQWLEDDLSRKYQFYPTTKLFYSLKSFVNGHREFNFDYRSSKSFGMALKNQRRTLETRLLIEDRVASSNVREYKFQVREGLDPLDLLNNSSALLR